MNRSYSYINMNEVEYTWIIKDFTDFFKFLKSGYYIESTKFDIDGTKECRFNLKMLFESEYIGCTLEWPQNSCKKAMTGQLSIMDKNNEKFKTLDVEIDYNKVGGCRNSRLLKVERNDLIYKALELFPDNNLKILCNLRLFDDYESVKPLNRPEHQGLSIKDHFKELLDSQSGSDVVFGVGDKEFKVHKLVLMTRSPVFSAMFDNDMVENNSNRVKVEDISSSIFELLIEFIYTDEITTELHVESGIDLLAAASKYQMEGLKVLCEDKLRDLVTINNAMDMLLMAETYHCTDFVKSINNFVKIHRKEIQNIIEPEHFSKHPHHVSLFITKKKK